MNNWVEVEADAIRHNIGEFRRRLTPETRFGAVVKSNAYGHGILEVARVAAESGADWLCVNSAGEGVRLRDEGHTLPVLVMGYVPFEELAAVVEHDLQPVVYNEETVDRLENLAAAAGLRVGVHLKLETGTNRQGMPLADMLRLAERLSGSGPVRLAGLSTHFANIEDTTDHGYAESQLDAYAAGVRALEKRSLPVPLRHTACSAAALLFDRTHLDLARVGISLYGLWPSKETYVSCRDEGKPLLELRPALTWKTQVAQVKDVPEGEYIGYGCTYRTTRPSRIAVLPVGYYEGYDRGLSGVAHVLVHGKRAPVRGRVCMNLTMVDVTDVANVELEDEVVLLGSQGDEHVSAEQVAAWCGTISYEVVSRIHSSLPRVVI